MHGRAIGDLTPTTIRLPLMGTPARGRIVGLGTAVVVAAAVVAFAPAWLSGAARGLAAYDAGTLVAVAILWRWAMKSNPSETAARAALDDPGRNVALVVVLTCIACALAAAVVILGHGPHAPTAHERQLLIGIGIVAIAAGWALIHTMFTFRYAHLFYYDSDDDGSAQRGLRFPGTDEPNDFDFAYFSFVIGMTFQVSDVEITDGGVRRLALYHALISFAYNTTIVALVINLVSNLFH